MRHVLALVRGAVGAVYARHVQYITVKRLDSPDAKQAAGPAADPATTCLIVDSVEALRVVAHEIPSTFRDSVEELTRRVAHGCVLCLARRRRPGGAGYEVVGYELAELGVFSALGRRKAAGADVVFSHWAEVVPAHRGRRIHGLLFATRDAYFRVRGGRIVVGVCARWNRASLRALRRDGAEVVGHVTQLAVFRLIVWETPWPRIEHALEVGRLGIAGDTAAVEELTPNHA